MEVSGSGRDAGRGKKAEAGFYLKHLKLAGWAAAALAVAAPAMAQTPRCNPTLGPIDTVRGDGRNELLPDIFLFCEGDGGGGGVFGFVIVTLNVPLTSRTLQAETGGSEVFLLIGEPPPSSQLGRPAELANCCNVVQGIPNGSVPNSIRFDNIPVLNAGTLAQTRLRIVNLRADASSLRGSANQDIVATIQISTTPATMVVPAQITLARPDFTPLAMNLRLPNDSGAFSSGVAVCQGNKPSVTASTPRDFNIRFTESFAWQFKKRSVGAGTANPSALTAQADPGVVYRTETGFHNPALAFQENRPFTGNMTSGGRAEHGTRLRARFSSIPAGAAIYVTSSQTAEGSSGGVLAARLTAADAGGAGPYTPLPGTPYVALPVVNGTAQAVWEILDTNTAAMESLSFGVIVSAPAGTSGGQITIAGELAPQGLAAASVPAFFTPSPVTAAVLIDGCGQSGNAPSVTSSCPLPPATIGLPYTQTVSAAGGAVPYTWSLAAGTLPGGLSLSMAGMITGTPGATGTSNFTLRVTDALGQAGLKECSLTVSPSSGGGFFLTGLNPSTVARGSADLPITLQGSGFTGNATAVWNAGTLAPVALPTQVQDANTVRATVPANLLTAAGVFPVAVRVSVLTSVQTTNTLNFTVTGGLAVSSVCPLPQAAAGAPYSYQLETVGGTGPFVWILSGGSLPPGISLSGTGLLSGTPQGTGTFNFSLSVADAAQQSAAKACALTVGTAPVGQLTITSIEPARILAGAAGANLAVRGSGFNASSAVIWGFGTAQQTVLSTTFVDAANLVAAAPANLLAAPGAVPVVVRNQTLTAATFSNARNVEIAAGVAVTTACPLPAASLNVAYSAPLTAQGGIPPYTWSLADGSLPAGLAVQAAGSVTGTPTVAGRSSFTLQVRDNQGNAATLACSLAVTGPFHAAPSALSFAVTQGAPPAFQEVSLTSAGGGLPLSFQTSAAPWLQVALIGSKTPARARVTVNATGLAPGNYTGAVVFNAEGASNAAPPVSVFLRVEPLPASQLRAAPAALVFALPRGSAARPEQAVLVSNAGGITPFSVTVAPVSGGSWLAALDAGGTVSPGSPRHVRFQANAAGLEPGTYLARVNVRNDANPAETVSLAASLSVSTGPDQLLTSTNTLQLRLPANMTRPAMELDVLSAGQNSLFWQAQAAMDTGGGWLQVAPSSDASAPGRPARLSVTMRPAGLAPGLYTGSVRLDAAADNAPRVVAAHLHVLPPAAVDTPYFAPGGLTFTAVTGGADPAPREVTLMVPGAEAATASYSVSANEQVFGVTALADGRTVRVAPSVAGLSPGFYRASLVAQVDGGEQTRQAELTLIVAPPGGCAKQALAVTPLEPFGGFAALAASGLPVRVNVTDNCGAPLEAGSVSARLTVGGEAPVSLRHMGGGVWAGDLAVPGRLAGQAAAVAIQAAEGSVAGVATIAGTIEADAPLPPEISDFGVISNSRFLPGQPVAPGSLTAVFGRGLAERQASAFPPETRLDQTSLSMPGLAGNEAARLFFASGGQVNAELPRTLLPGALRQIVARRGNFTSRPGEVAVAAASPGIFTVNLQGTGQGAILDAAATAEAGGAVLAAPGTAAPRGGIVSIYCEGLGRVTPEPAPGQPAPSAEPLARTALPVTVTIGGREARITYSGLAPGYFGLYQINAFIPEDAPAGDAVPVAVSVGGVASNVATLAVR